SVRITLNDEPLDQTQDVWTTQTVGAFDPNGIPGGVAVVSEPYHVNSYEQLVALRTGQPVLGPLGDGSLEVASAAMSAATGRIAAVVNRRSDNTQELVVGLPGTADDLSTSIQADQLVSPVFG